MAAYHGSMHSDDALCTKDAYMPQPKKTIYTAHRAPIPLGLSDNFACYASTRSKSRQQPALPTSASTAVSLPSCGGAGRSSPCLSPRCWPPATALARLLELGCTLSHLLRLSFSQHGFGCRCRVRFLEQPNALPPLPIPSASHITIVGTPQGRPMHGPDDVHHLLRCQR
jgi:hypothetical protein